MSKYFVLPEEGIGEGGDIYIRHYWPKKARKEYPDSTQSHWWSLYVGEKELGFITKSIWGWNAWSYNFDNKTMNSQVDGFKTRLMAALFIVKHWGYWNERRLDEAEKTKAKKRRKSTAKTS